MPDVVWAIDKVRRQRTPTPSTEDQTSIVCQARSFVIDGADTRPGGGGGGGVTAAVVPHKPSRSMAATTEAGRRLRDMMGILKKRAPRLRPNTVPRSCWPFFDDPTLASWAPASEGQRVALAAALAAERRKALASAGGEGEGESGVRLALVAEMDADGGYCHIQSAKFVSEVEADLHSVARILNLHSRGESDELRLCLEHFLSVNGYPSPSSSSSGDPLREAQEQYSLAYAITVCLNAAPAIRAVAGPERVPLPLAPDVDAKALVSRLFGGEVRGVVKGKGEGKRKGPQRQEEEEEEEEEVKKPVGEEEQADGGPAGGKKRRRRSKGKGKGKGQPA